MDNAHKQQITAALKEYVARYESQNKASNSLKGVSASTVSQVLNENWDLIKESMWRSIASQIGWKKQLWVGVETRDFKFLSHLLSETQRYSKVYAVTGDAGTGKTFAIAHYVSSNKRAYHLKCAEYWTDRYFLKRLLKEMGRDHGGGTIAQMMEEVVYHLKRQETPIIAIDEVDKLNDKVLRFFITIYNELEGHCGFVLCATNHLRKRIERGVSLNRKGYKEIFSRINRDFLELNGLGSTDITQLCIANGITNKKSIKAIITECQADLRIIKEEINAIKKIQAA